MNNTPIRFSDLNAIPCLIPFKTSVQDIGLPEKFTFPFCYEPHPLAIIAAEELQYYIHHAPDLEHDFGHGEDEGGLGKMLGVLVVKTEAGELAYLAAFSGKLAGGNHYAGFVPPIFDTLDEKGFYKKAEAETHQINVEINFLENNPTYQSLMAQKEEETKQAALAIHTLKLELKQAKKARKQKREAGLLRLTPAQYSQLEAELGKESTVDHYRLKDMIKNRKSQLDIISDKLKSFEDQIQTLKEKRRCRSVSLQHQLFEQYAFLNQYGQLKNLYDIFEISGDKTPPSGAGECAAPKLLHYAFRHHLKPVVMAEFWWGRSPSSEIRKHGLFYPACNGKCKPILAHMLEGIAMDDNPMLNDPAPGKDIAVVMEDEYLLVVNKPTELLSVPGKKIVDSVYSRMKQLYPDATGPLIVHRLDMSTSGLMLIAKTKEIHRHLQNQFIKRKITKRYVAVLDGHPDKNEGEIVLPLRVDVDDRPRQLVCYTHGKPAHTRWKVIERKEKVSRIHFFPVTGRTHQLRVHASHHEGLGIPISGDDLYGSRADRLYLHAEYLRFEHPVSRKTVEVECMAEF